MKAFFKSDPKPHRTKAIRKSIADRETGAVNDDQPPTYKSAFSGAISGASPTREIKPDDPQPALNPSSISKLVRIPSTQLKPKRDEPEVWEDARPMPAVPPMPKERFMSERDVSITGKDEQKHRRNTLKRVVFSPKAEMPSDRDAAITEKAQLEASPDEKQVNDGPANKNGTKDMEKSRRSQIETPHMRKKISWGVDQEWKDLDGSGKENQTKDMKKSMRSQIGILQMVNTRPPDA